MYQKIYLLLPAFLASQEVTGLPLPKLLGDQRSCLEKYNLCVHSTDTRSLSLCNTNIITCLSSLLHPTNHKTTNPALTIQLTTPNTLPFHTQDDITYCPQPGDGDDDDDPCTISCEPGVQYYQHPFTCARFCQCSNGRPLDMPCPDGLYWDISLEVCNFPAAADCHLPTCSGDSSSKMPYHAQGYSIVSSPRPNPKVNEDDAACEIKCGADKEFFADPYDCGSFYECEDGTAYLQSCPSGLEFNPELEVCDHPLSAGCVLPSCADSKMVFHAQDDPCEITCGAGTELFADPEDCNGFYECNDGVASHQSCPAGLVFNPTYQVCDDPLTAGCVLPSCGETDGDGEL